MFSQIFVPAVELSYYRDLNDILHTCTLGGLGVQSIGPNCLRFREMVAILNQQKPHFFTFPGVRGTLYGNLTTNDLDLRNSGQFKGKKLHFSSFSEQISPKMA